MGVSFKRIGLHGLFGLLCVTASFSLVAPATLAQQASGNRIETVSEALDRLYSRTSGTFYTDITLGGQLDYLLGFGTLVTGTFPENEISADARLIGLWYQDVLNQQVSTTPLIRTPDLNSPFSSSLLSSPDASTRVVGSELVYERVPLR